VAELGRSVKIQPNQNPQGLYMFEALIGKKVILTKIDGDGTVEIWNLKVLSGEGCLVTVEDTDGKIQVINMSSPNNIELKQQ
jgi:hypothetical protein